MNSEAGHNCYFTGDLQSLNLVAQGNTCLSRTFDSSSAYGITGHDGSKTMSFRSTGARGEVSPERLGFRQSA